MAINDTLWVGGTADKLFLQSGQFTSTVKDSEDITSINSNPTGISWDGQNAPWCHVVPSNLVLQSGQFSSTVKSSVNVAGIDTSVTDVSYDVFNTPWVGENDKKLYLLSGQFTTTLKTSEDVSAVEANPTGISYDNTNTPYSGQAPRLYLQSGQFTSTLKDSEDTTSIDSVPMGVTYDGTNTPWTGQEAKKLYLTSGQFTSTIKTSEDVTGIDSAPVGIETNDVNSRLEIPIGNASLTLPILTVLGGFFPVAEITLPIFTMVGLTEGANLNGDIDIDLPALTLDGAASFDDDITTIFPVIALSSRAYNGSAPECIVMNTKNFAVSEYLNYGFNSMARFNGANLICDQNGIYEQDTSDADNTGVDDYKIKAHVKSGTIDIHSDVIQRLRNFWLNYQTDGDVEIVVGADKKATRYYPLPFHSGLGGINERRAKPERGIRNRHFNFKIRNVNGSQLEIDKLTITLEPIVSKRR